MRENWHYSVAIVAAVLSALATDTQATLVYSTDFEPPTYAQRGVSGQDGWTGFGHIQSTTVASGIQALHIHYHDSTFSFPQRPLSAPTAGQIITLEADFRLRHRLSDQGFAVMRIVGDTGTIGSIGYLNGNYRFANMNTYVYGEPFAPDDTWHHFVLELNFPMKTVSATFNGMSLGTLPMNNPVTPSALTSISTTVNQAPAPLDAYFDNISITSIPEPGSLALLGFALPVVMRRRRM